jgi:hypothetical protein
MLRILILATALGAAASHAQTVQPFPADDCTPGYTAAGDFVDRSGRVIDQSGWRAQSVGVVVNAEGRRVVLAEACLKPRQSANGERGGNFGAIGLLIGVAILGGLAGGGSSTNGTN